jgi:hypothetical protein
MSVKNKIIKREQENQRHHCWQHYHYHDTHCIAKCSAVKDWAFSLKQQAAVWPGLPINISSAKFMTG